MDLTRSEQFVTELKEKLASMCEEAMELRGVKLSVFEIATVVLGRLVEERWAKLDTEKRTALQYVANWLHKEVGEAVERLKTVTKGGFDA